MSKFYDEYLGNILDEIEKSHSYIQGLYAERSLFKNLLLFYLINSGEIETIFDNSDLISIDGYDLEYEVTRDSKLKVTIQFPEKGNVQ